MLKKIKDKRIKSCLEKVEKMLSNKHET